MNVFLLFIAYVALVCVFLTVWALYDLLRGNR